MSNDLIEHIGVLARRWEVEAPSVALEEIVGRTAPVPFDVDPPALLELSSTRAGHPRPTLWIALSAAAALVIGALIVVGRNSPATDLQPVATEASAAAPVSTAVATTTPAASTSAPTTVPAPSPVDFAAKLSEIDVARAAALSRFTTVGFSVRQLAEWPDGTIDLDKSAQVVLRNDGSAAVASDSIVWSYYDATVGTARLAFTGMDGQVVYQELVGQADNSVALGVPTGLPNGIVEQFPLTTDFVVDIADDVIDGRPTWRIDQVYDVPGSTATTAEMSSSIWIDVNSGITIKTRNVGMQTRNDVALVETITLSNLELDTPMPPDFPGAFPENAAVDRSGDPTSFGPVSIEAAAIEFGSTIVAPTLAADLTAVSRMNFGNEDGTTTISPSLIMRWFDGFVRTEYRLVSFPPSMGAPETCPTCTGSLLEELQSWNGALAAGGVTAQRDGLGASITGPSQGEVRAILDSLVEVPAG